MPSFSKKGPIAAIHCPPSSECRSLVTDPPPQCQTKTLFRNFDPEFDAHVAPCECCFSCISRHADDGCHRCSLFLETYIPKQKVSNVKFPSIRKGLKSVILDLFCGLNLTEIKIENRVTLCVQSFASDFVKVFDEINHCAGVKNFWHLPPELSEDIFAVLTYMSN